jgi:hypothetical protein
MRAGRASSRTSSENELARVVGCESPKPRPAMFFSGSVWPSPWMSSSRVICSTWWSVSDGMRSATCVGRAFSSYALAKMTSMAGAELVVGYQEVSQGWRAHEGASQVRLTLERASLGLGIEEVDDGDEEGVGAGEN